jgi:hypothetical protein
MGEGAALLRRGGTPSIGSAGTAGKIACADYARSREAVDGDAT